MPSANGGVWPGNRLKGNNRFHKLSSKLRNITQTCTFKTYNIHFSVFILVTFSFFVFVDFVSVSLICFFHEFGFLSFSSSSINYFSFLTFSVILYLSNYTYKTCKPIKHYTCTLCVQTQAHSHTQIFDIVYSPKTGFLNFKA